MSVSANRLIPYAAAVSTSVLGERSPYLREKELWQLRCKGISGSWLVGAQRGETHRSESKLFLWNYLVFS